MPRSPDDQRRRELLDDVVEAFARGGIGQRSLREIAASVDTSHRMLLHHFGSREQLLLRVVEEVERRQMGILSGLPEEPPEAFAAMWADLRRPDLRPLERLFFECYARASQGEEPFVHLLPGAVDDWMTASREHASERVGDDMIRLALAVTRGLLLDLVATGDEAGVDAAAARFVELLRAIGRPDPGRTVRD